MRASSRPFTHRCRAPRRLGAARYRSSARSPCCPRRLNHHPPTQLRHVRFENGRTSSVVDELPVASRFDQSGACQFLQVMGDRRLSNRETTAQALAPDFGLLGDVLQDFEAARISKRLGDALELLGVHVLAHS